MEDHHSTLATELLILFKLAGVFQLLSSYLS